MGTFSAASGMPQKYLATEKVHNQNDQYYGLEPLFWNSLTFNDNYSIFKNLPGELKNVYPFGRLWNKKYVADTQN